MQNQAFSYDTAPDLLVITCIDDNKLGQFIFPKDILLKEKSWEHKIKKARWLWGFIPSGIPLLATKLKRAKCGSFQYFVDLGLS